MTDQTPTQIGKQPPARHFCSSPYHQGPRWLLSCYFYRNKRTRTGLQYYCQTCTKIAMRAENLSENTKRNRYEYSRRYKEAERRKSGIPPRQTHNPKFRGKQLFEWLQQFITYQDIGPREKPRQAVFLNGRRLDETDQRWIGRLPEIDRSPLKRVDELATKYDLPLWEIAIAAGAYRRDRRSRVRKTAS